VRDRPTDRKAVGAKKEKKWGGVSVPLPTSSDNKYNEKDGSRPAVALKIFGDEKTGGGSLIISTPTTGRRKKGGKEPEEVSELKHKLKDSSWNAGMVRRNAVKEWDHRSTPQKRVKRPLSETSFPFDGPTNGRPSRRKTR